MSYFSVISDSIRSTLKGLSLTARHLRKATQRRTSIGVADAHYFDLKEGLVTLQYPHEALPIPDNGRYRLHNEIDDCIVCDKCAKVCPVDCITIDPIKATEEVGRASDGSPIRLYAATFDIDMAKCCYCGLCTVVCPTECLTMEKKFDYSTFDLNALNYEFANLTPEQADEKRALYEQFVQEKEAAKRSKAIPATSQPVADATNASVSEPAAKPKPAFRPGMKPAATPPADAAKPAEDGTPAEPTTPAAPPAKPRPAFRPGMKPGVSPPPAPVSSEPGEEAHALHPLTDPTPDEAERIAMAGIADQPHVTEPLTDAEKNQPVESADASPVVPKKTASFRPSMKPVPAAPPVTNPDATAEAPAPKPKPAFRPSMKPASASPASETSAAAAPDASPEAALPPTIAEGTAPPATPKPAFRPTMKPASAKPVADAKPGTAKAAPESVVPSVDTDSPTTEEQSSSEESAGEPRLETSAPKPKPAFRPTMKPAPANAAPADEQSGTTEPTPPGDAVPAKPKPAFRPTMKPKSSE